MLRNSTEKYKKIYGSTPSKDLKTATAINTPTKYNVQTRMDSTVKSLTQVRYASTKKLQTYNVFNEKHNFIYKYSAQPKQEDTKLRKTLKKCGHSSKNTQQQKQYRTCADNFFEQKSVVVSALQLARDSEDFIENMAKNTLFFCTHCFQFVFDIEKKRHYPDCKDAFIIKNRETEEFYNLVNRKLHTIVQLSKYTQTKSKEIQKMYQSIQRGQFQGIDRVRYPKTYEFFKLDQIELAFAYTYCTLLKGIKYRPQTSLFTCF